MSCRPIIGGLGNVDDNLIELPDGPYRAGLAPSVRPRGPELVDLVGG